MKLHCLIFVLKTQNNLFSLTKIRIIIQSKLKNRLVHKLIVKNLFVCQNYRFILNNFVIILFHLLKCLFILLISRFCTIILLLKFSIINAQLFSFKKLFIFYKLKTNNYILLLRESNVHVYNNETMKIGDKKIYSLSVYYFLIDKIFIYFSSIIYKLHCLNEWLREFLFILIY